MYYSIRHKFGKDKVARSSVVFGSVSPRSNHATEKRCAVQYQAGRYHAGFVNGGRDT